MTATKTTILQPIAERWQAAPAGATVFTTSSYFDTGLSRDSALIAAHLRKLNELQDAKAIVFAKQVHGGKIEIIGSEVVSSLHQAPDCDGLFTDEPGIALVIRTADCYPVVMTDKAATKVAVLHAGWRGTFEDITGTAIELLLESGTQPTDLCLWIGPGISGECYEVSEHLIRQFQEKFPDVDSFCNGRFLDLAELNRQQALRRGIPSNNITFCQRCTFTETAVFHSHRRQGKARGQLHTVALLGGVRP